MAPETKDEYIIAWAITVKTTTMTYCGIFFFIEEEEVMTLKVDIIIFM